MKNKKFNLILWVCLIPIFLFIVFSVFKLGSDSIILKFKWEKVTWEIVSIEWKHVTYPTWKLKTDYDETIYQW
jgi:hypothetical protein